MHFDLCSTIHLLHVGLSVFATVDTVPTSTVTQTPHLSLHVSDEKWRTLIETESTTDFSTCPDCRSVSDSQNHFKYWLKKKSSKRVSSYPTTRLASWHSCKPGSGACAGAFGDLLQWRTVKTKMEKYEVNPARARTALACPYYTHEQALCVNNY